MYKKTEKYEAFYHTPSFLFSCSTNPTARLYAHRDFPPNPRPRFAPRPLASLTVNAPRSIVSVEKTKSAIYLLKLRFTNRATWIKLTNEHISRREQKVRPSSHKANVATLSIVFRMNIEEALDGHALAGRVLGNGAHIVDPETRAVVTLMKVRIHCFTST